jgi:hypothetical protein
MSEEPDLKILVARTLADVVFCGANPANTAAVGTCLACGVAIALTAEGEARLSAPGPVPLVVVCHACALKAARPGYRIELGTAAREAVKRSDYAKRQCDEMTRRCSDEGEA